jgi:spore maturation protein SpmA
LFVSSDIGTSRSFSGQTIEASFKTAKLAVEIAIGLVGLLCFWLGLFQIAEKSGLTDKLAWLLNALVSKVNA